MPFPLPEKKKGKKSNIARATLSLFIEAGAIARSLLVALAQLCSAPKGHTLPVLINHRKKVKRKEIMEDIPKAHMMC